ncbi:glycosyltransferase family 2 protein [Marinobacterium weihaiense]|uniref:Glycosyltransferase family 2 protein n=1 Tax=Marinobacterium weihaiense TaxID=2851016 RepID=A0ABS6M7Q6_9GAMM|nr:glycosyltransferase family 2 protein [Marinobacterium weihaiense]MBV0932292.1 glycosyltransferase family 2 protein [Marinobacterium weihaiense]
MSTDSNTAWNTGTSTARHDGEHWLLSLVVPVKNEEDNIQPFLDAVLETLTPRVPALEIIFIDDGSTDQTLPMLRRLGTADQRIRYLSFSRNFGKEAAMTAGLEASRGDAVVPMDVDLQHPPEAVLEFIRHWRDGGWDMVYGVRMDANAETTGKKATSSLFYRIFNRVSHTDIPPSAGDFRLLSRRVVDVLGQLPERNRFMKGLYAWVGFRSIGVPYHQPARLHGNSRFNYWKLWNFALDGLVGFSSLPLRVWSYLGGGLAFCSLLFMLWIITRTLLFGIETPGYASVMSAILFFGGVQLLSIGVLGEYIARLFIESKQRPLYIIAEHSDDQA